jgi:transposase
LEVEISELRTLVQELKDEISLLKGSLSSRTSSIAPSHDIGRSNQISLRVSSGKKSGGQPGHAGSTLSFSDTPDEIIDHHPNSCKHCGEDLHNVAGDFFTRRQVVDIPPVSPLYFEHRSHVKTCPVCLLQNRGIFPDSVTAPIQYGTRIEAMTGYLSVFQGIPYNRICKLFNDFFGLQISEGSIDNFLKNLTEKANPFYEKIRTLIQQSPVVGSDETGCRVNGKKHWFHVWQTSSLTFIVAFASRGYDVIKQYFPDGFINSLYVSDCWASQLKVPAKAHQLCMAHLLRELINFAEKLGRKWSVQMKALFMRAIALKKNMTETDYINPPLELAELNTELDKLLETDFSKFHAKEQAFIKRMIKHRQSIFTFLYHKTVPPDNNASERAIRNVKIKTKVSGQFRRADGKGADRYAKIRSVIDTSIKNGQDVYAALIALANGKMGTVLE